MINLRSSATFFRQSSFTITTSVKDDDTTCHQKAQHQVGSSSSDAPAAITSETTTSAAHQTTAKTIAMLTKRCRRVRFSTVEFKLYPITLGGCTVPNHGGPPIGIDYSAPPIEVVKCKLDEYEMGKIIFIKSSSLSCITNSKYADEYHTTRRRGGGRTSLFQLSANERCDLLLRHGVTFKRISCSTINCRMIRDDRRKSFQSYYHWNMLKINFFSGAFRSRV